MDKAALAADLVQRVINGETQYADASDSAIDDAVLARAERIITALEKSDEAVMSFAEAVCAFAYLSGNSVGCAVAQHGDAVFDSGVSEARRWVLRGILDAIAGKQAVE